VSVWRRRVCWGRAGSGRGTNGDCQTLRLRRRAVGRMSGVWLVVVVMMRRARDAAPKNWGGLQASFGNAGAAAARWKRRYRSADPSLAFLSLFAPVLDRNLPPSGSLHPQSACCPPFQPPHSTVAKPIRPIRAHRSLRLLPFEPSSHRGVPIRSQPLHDAFASTRSIA
jgi:hypothetical protein